MSALRLSSMKAAISSVPLLLLAAALFAFAENIGPMAGFLAPVAVLAAVLVFFYVSGTRSK